MSARVRRVGHLSGASAWNAATLVALEGERLTLHAEVAFAPGAPLCVEVAGLELDARCVGSRRVAAGDAFQIVARLVGLRREQREALAAAMRPPEG